MSLQCMKLHKGDTYTFGYTFEFQVRPLHSLFIYNEQLTFEYVSEIAKLVWYKTL